MAVALAVVAGSIVNSVHAQNPTGRVEVKKDYEITIYWRMTADQFLGKKTEASA